MTPLQINIAIAEFMGPKLFVIAKHINDPFCYYRENARGYTYKIEEAWKVPEEVGSGYINGGPDQPDRVVIEPAPIPNYFGDLNAMHSAEETLDPKQTERFAEFMLDVLEIPTPFIGTARCAFLTGHASAPQRAEAFLRTIGKWKE